MKRQPRFFVFSGSILLACLVSACGSGSPAASGGSGGSSGQPLGTGGSTGWGYGGGGQSPTTTFVVVHKPDAGTDGGRTGKTDGGVFLAPCVQDADCLSDHCLETRDGTMHCSEQCVATCPDSSWRCAVVLDVVNPSDPAAACVPKDTHLCQPCLVDDDCRVTGFADQAACVPYWDPQNTSNLLGSFCGMACTANADCPTGYDCEGVVGVTGKQCVRTDRQCSCLPQWADQNLQTVCEAHAGANRCSSTRTCGASGLTACTARTPTAEVCDGIDNDCDGTIDNGGDALCNDELACTQNVCAGSKGCQFPVLDGRCLINGTCYSDSDSAPSNGCLECLSQTSKVAWSNAPSTKACDDGQACTINDHCSAGTCAGTGTVAAADAYEPNNDQSHAHGSSSWAVNDDGNQFNTIAATLSAPGQDDWYSFSITDKNQTYVGDSVCGLSTKNPRPTAKIVSGVATSVCVTHLCNGGHAPTSYSCQSGQATGNGTCCDKASAIVVPDCSTWSSDDSGTVFVSVTGPANTCGSYSIQIGNTDSGCGW